MTNVMYFSKIFLLFFLLVPTTAAQELSENEIDKYYRDQPGSVVSKGTSVNVVAWISDFKAYRIKVLSSKSNTTKIATFEEFYQSIQSKFDLKKLTNSPESIIGQKVELTNDLNTMSGQQIKARKAYLQKTLNAVKKSKK